MLPLPVGLGIASAGQVTGGKCWGCRGSPTDDALLNIEDTSLSAVTYGLLSYMWCGIAARMVPGYCRVPYPPATGPRGAAAAAPIVPAAIMPPAAAPA